MEINSYNLHIIEIRGEKMIQLIWIGMLSVSIFTAVATGNLQKLSEEMILSTKSSVELCIYMAGIVAMWTGVLKAGEEVGLLESVEKILQPLISFLFPEVKEEKARRYIAVNISANVLGLGWAATPSGLKAMQYLQELNGKAKVASDEMCTFLILNISSLQLIPLTMIAYRSEYGSVNPTEIILPAILATTISTAVGIVFCKLMQTMLK